MIKCLFFFLLPALFPAVLFGQGDNYTAATIPQALREDAHSVVREDQINFEVSAIDEATYSEHEVITVLDEEGSDALIFGQSTSSFYKLQDAEIRVYDANGKFINRYKMKELHVFSSGEGLVADGKDYEFRVTAPSYPLTVVYDYEIRMKGTINYPTFEIQKPNQSIEHSTYTATVPDNLDLRFKAVNIDVAPSVTAKDKNRIYQWGVKSRPAFAKEEGAAGDQSNLPQVLLAPNKFSMDGNEGDLTSWKNFGSWYYNLCQGAMNLPDAAKSRLRQMVAGAHTEKDKMRIIYKYLQANFRYVSIQLGIGGFKPFDAAFVDQKKYGDCKALSNYMKACLDAIGVVSYYAVINAEYNSAPVDPSFPHNGFNHVILCVPGDPDTTWLECTSTFSDFGVLGGFTENRNALLIKPEGGVLVPTPRSKPVENTFTCLTKVQLHDDGSGESKSDIKTSGECKDQLIHFLVNEKKDDQEKYLVSYLGFLQPDDFALIRQPSPDSAETEFKLEIEKIPEFTAGSKMFLSPRIYKIWKEKLPSDESRTQAYYFEYPFLKTDTTEYQLPDGYTIENLPKPRNKKFEYGSFTTNYTYDSQSNTVTTVAALSLFQNRIPPDIYAGTLQFFSNVIDEYTEKIIIKKR